MNYSENRARGSEVFVGGLPRTVTESTIHQMFSPYGNITEIRLMKDQNGISKGFCFVRYAEKESALRAKREKNGVEVQGRKIGVDVSLDKCSLYFGNLKKDWSSEEFDQLIRQAFKEVVSVELAMAPSAVVSGRRKTLNRGFAFVRFASHGAAARAHRTGSKPDFMLGGDLHPVVDWAQPEPEFDPAEMAKVKIAFVGNLPQNASEDFLHRLFGPMGKVEKVALSRKGRQPVGFVHFSTREGLDRAIREINGRTIVASDQGPPFTIQVSVARPMEKGTKWSRDEDIEVEAEISKRPDYSRGLQHDDAALSPTLKAHRADNSVHLDAYEASFALLSPVVRDRLDRLFRLGIGTRYDIDIHCVNSLKELPEQAAIAVLDQFLFSGGDKNDKRAFFDSLVAKQSVNLLTRSSPPPLRSDYASQAPPIEPPIDHPPRYIRYSSSPGPYGSNPSQYSREPLYSRPPVVQPKDETTSLQREPLIGTSFLGYGIGPKSETLLSPPVTIERRQIRYDPLTGQQYKFDPFTGEPIEPELGPHHFGSLR
ncbi:RNA-binding protein 47 [Rhynchospora pubera]|uniref:RNA-binding protein 47 n=1 Tax=Rhynchospora pubera TaxID=906938 RepID=A0AAV8F986_9POAL|nr:RNA-binding protein 47 [Rhynchospora pubera]